MGHFGDRNSVLCTQFLCKPIVYETIIFSLSLEERAFFMRGLNLMYASFCGFSSVNPPNSLKFADFKA